MTAGSSHLIDLLEAVDDSRCAKDTMVVVTYDEFGGQWDHVTPSVLATIERRFDLDPLSDRDAAVRDLSSVFHANRPRKP